jgi:glycosyltransferase involved in cell wall biosynthesis
MSVLPISVVIPLYNAGRHVEAALDTVAAQSPGAAEVIVIDDGSTDDGPARVIVRGDERVRLISQANAGVAAARNVGLAAATGTFAAFLDADDLWCPGHLARLAEAAAAVPEAAVIGEGFVSVPADATTAEALARRTAPAHPRRADYVAEAAEGRAPFYTSSCMVRRDAALAEGGFPHGESHGEDLALWIRLAERHGAAATGAVGALYRRSPGGLTGRSVRVPDVAMRTLDALRRDAAPDRQAPMRRLRSRLALAHALDALSRGEAADARAALAESGADFPLRQVAARVLAALPARIAQAAFSARTALGASR